MNNSIKILCFCLFLGLKGVKAQEMGLEYQRNIESVNFDTSNFVISNSSFLLSKAWARTRLAYGLEIQEALWGSYGGLYVFGLVADFDYRHNKLPLSLNMNGFVGGGGGAGAPDGSGLAVRYALGAKWHINPQFSLLSRYSNYKFLTGEISGQQFQFGFSYGLDGVFNKPMYASNSLKQTMSLRTLFLSLNQHDSSRLREMYSASLIDVEYGVQYTRNLKGLIRLQAAISSKIDGYMGYYSGLSYALLQRDYFSWSIVALLGSSGGGAMRTDGGVGAQYETSIAFGKQFKVVLGKGITKSFNGEFNAAYTQVGISYSFESSILLGASGKPIQELEFNTKALGVLTGMQMHLAPKGLDVNEKTYTAMGLMSFGLSYPISKHFEVLGQTRWAVSGDYGAYAEGIIGLEMKLSNREKYTISLPVQMVVAGGGGVNVGKGVGGQLNLQFEYRLTETTSASFSVGKLAMIQGNYNPVTMHVGVKQDLSFYLK